MESDRSARRFDGGFGLRCVLLVAARLRRVGRGLGGRRFGTVSYTHLDVYKRQVKAEGGRIAYAADPTLATVQVVREGQFPVP